MRGMEVSCPDCGRVTTSTGAMKVHNCLNRDSWTYSFRCPVCAGAFSYPADPATIYTLLEGGVRVREWRMPEDDLARHNPTPIVEGEIEAFVSLLNSEFFMPALELVVNKKKGKLE